MDDALTKLFPRCHDLKRRVWLIRLLTIKVLGHGDCSCSVLEEDVSKKRSKKVPFITRVSRSLPVIFFREGICKSK